MKAFLAIIFVFVVVIVLVFQTGYESHRQTEKQVEAFKIEPARQDVILEPVAAVAEPASQVTHTEPAQEDPEPEQEEPDRVHVIYIEKTYVKEIYHTERVVYREPEQHNYRQTSIETGDCCSNFTGSARTKCYRYINDGYTCPQFEATISYVYQPNNIRR